MRSLLASVVLGAVLCTVIGATSAGAGEGPTCEVTYRVKRPAYLSVQSPGHRGAIGVWKHRNDQRYVVRVAPGEGMDWSAVRLGSGGELRLVRCDFL
jgi:hypothetical protein